MRSEHLLGAEAMKRCVGQLALRFPREHWRSAAIAGLLFAIATARCERQRNTAPPPGTELPPPFYSSEPIHATAIDAANGKGIEGAIIVAVWRRVGNLTEHWSGIFHLVEVSTNGRGEFTIPRWGPRPSPRDSFLDRRDPEIWVIKDGYLVGYFDNAGESTPLLPNGNEAPRFVKLPPAKMIDWARGKYARGPTESCIWNGRELKLRKAASPDEAARSLGAANPLDPHLPSIGTPLPLFWAEWERAKSSLPPDVQRSVTFPPRCVIDYDLKP